MLLQMLKISLRAVIRDDKGRIVATAVKPSRLSCDLSFTEAETVDLGLQVAKEAKLVSIIIETDCHEVSDFVNNKKGSKIEIFWVTTVIKGMRGDYQSVIFQHVLRFINEVAHGLAKICP